MYLHEEPGDQGFPDVEVVVPTGKVSARAAEVEPVHDSGQLLSHIVRALQRPVVDKVVIAPLRVFLACKSKYNTGLHVLLYEHYIVEFISNKYKRWFSNISISFDYYKFVHP